MIHEQWALEVHSIYLNKPNDCCVQLVLARVYEPEYGTSAGGIALLCHGFMRLHKL